MAAWRRAIGQILMEQVVYEPDSGQLLTASFMDYAMPRADDMCGMEDREQSGADRVQSAGRQGRGRGRHGRRHAGGDERRHGRAGAARRARARHAGD